MRITRETLLKVVRDTVSQRTRADRSLLSVYLCGSLLEEDYLLGGTADIDLFFIHADYEGQPREIVHLTDDVHLDIAHHLYRDYRQARRLRVDPWFGPNLARCQILHDPQHFLDFTQASVRGQFDSSEYVLERARKHAEPAREAWLAFHTGELQAGPEEVLDYFKALEQAANAVASLNGAPLTERRFLLRFGQRAEAAGRPGLYPGLLGLLGAPNVDQDTLHAWLEAWQAAFDAVPAGDAPPRLHSPRRAYYLSAFESILRGEQPQAVLWPLLRTWTMAVDALPVDAPARAAWQAAFERLGLQGSAFEERIAALDAYLDQVEETLEKWAEEMGLYLAR